MSREFTPVKVGLLELLRGSTGAQFVIPAYQRNYTWTPKKEVKQLFDDLTAVLKNECNKHFVGIMIYLEKSISPFHLERSVIDGQQRLTTTFLTLYAIKELMIEKKEYMEAEKLESWYLVNPHNDTNKYRLKPLVSDDEVYQHIVNRDFANIPDRNSNVYKNFIYIKSLLKEMTESFTLQEILAALDKLYIVVVPVGVDDYPQKIFESINAHGAKLTAADLIRNYLLMPIDSEQQDYYYAKYWKKIETYINYDAKILESFFRFYVMAKKRCMVNKNMVYQSFMKWYEENKSDLGIDNIFVDILNYAKWYHNIYNAPLSDLETELRQAIFEYRLNKSYMPAPLLMELYDIYSRPDEENKPRITAGQLAETVTILNSYMMRRSLCDMDTSDISNYFPDLLKQLLDFCNGDYSLMVDTFKRLLIDLNRNGGKFMPTDEYLANQIRNANMYRLREWVFIFLRKLESEDNPAPVDFSSLSIEHLMPQKATDMWMAHLGCDKETYEYNVNRLGNLTFAAKSDNSRMGNQVWEYKNKVLSSTGHLKINESLLQHERWQIEDIGKRTEVLIDEINRLYPYYGNKEKKAFKIPIFLNYNDIEASAFYYPETSDVEVIAGSMMKDCKEGEDMFYVYTTIREKLLDTGMLKHEDGKLIYAENYLYRNPEGAEGLKTLSFVTQMICAEFNVNAADCWYTKDGRRISEVELISMIPASQLELPENSQRPANSVIVSEGSVPNATEGGEVLIMTKKVDWSFFTSAITMTNEAREMIQADKNWKMRRGENRNIRIVINGEQYDSILSLYNHDGRINDVLQIRYPGKNSLILDKLHQIFRDKFEDIKQKRINEKNGIEYREKVLDRYVHIYKTNIPNVLKFKF